MNGNQSFEERDEDDFRLNNNASDIIHEEHEEEGEGNNTKGGIKEEVINHIESNQSNNNNNDDDNISIKSGTLTPTYSNISNNRLNSPSKLNYNSNSNTNLTRNSSGDTTFPGLNLRSFNNQRITSSASNFNRRPISHPQINRLRSTSNQSSINNNNQQQQRFSSNSSSHSTLFNPTNGDRLNTTRRRNDSNDTTTDNDQSIIFDKLSRVSSISNINDLNPTSLENPSTASNLFNGDENTASTSNKAINKSSNNTFKWSPLRRISTRIYPPPPPSLSSNNITHNLGEPTVLAVSGIIAIGTSKGWVQIFDFGQNLLCICGNESIVNEAGPVTSLGISQDHTFLAVGHSLGFIHLYSLLKPSQPARSVPPTSLVLVATGRKEGHLLGSKILRINFVGSRHTAVVSSDEFGLAFYHSLGRIFGMDSTDIIRMLGRYPDPLSIPPSSSSSSPSPSPSLPSTTTNGNSKSKKSTTILDMSSLPLGPIKHLTDNYSLIAIMTNNKLVIVGLKPSPRTWWRGIPFSSTSTSISGKGEKGEERTGGVLAWFPSDILFGSSTSKKTSGEMKEDIEGEDPILAFSWGKQIRLVRVGREKEKEKGIEVNLEKNGKLSSTSGESTPVKKVLELEFEELESWNCDEEVLGLQWYNQRVIFAMTAHYVDVFDVRTRTRIGRDIHDILNVVSHNYFTSADTSKNNNSLSYSGSFKTHKRKIFLLTLSNIQAGAVLSWADRILGLMQPGSILEAIEVTTSYLLGYNDSSTINLPEDIEQRRQIVEPKLKEILTSSIEFVFSEDRLRDGSHDDSATMQKLFEGLIPTCVRACLATGDIEWLFSELYEKFEMNGIESIFLNKIEPFILSGSVHALPPSVSQRLINIHEERGEFEAAQRIIWHVDPEFLDLNQALGLCQRQKLYDALIYVYTRSMHDYVSPIVELLSLVRRIQRHRKQRPRRIGEIEFEDQEDEMNYNSSGREDVEVTAPDAYKVYAYLSLALSGLSYPSKDPLPYDEGILARNSIYSFLFSNKTVTWPTRGGIPILASDDDGEESPYPYLRILLQFDAEAMLDALDLAFEDPYLEDEVKGKPINRQRIINLLLSVMATETTEFTPVDRTFLHIFIARNLPKYPQYIQLQSSVLYDILVRLASDQDQSTIDDRQLAAEYLLSVYTPENGAAMILLFEEAGFLRILRSIYKGERRWAELASTYLRDPDVGADIFGFLRQTLRLASRTNEDQKKALAETILEAVPSLVQADESGLQHTAELVDEFLSSHHSDVIDRLASTPWRQFAYLRCLLEPSSINSDLDPTSSTIDRQASTTLDTSQRLLYLSLLCKHEPYHVIRYLETDSQHLGKESEALKICEQAGVYDALIWAIDQRGDTKAALDRVDDTLESRTDLLVHTMLSSTVEEVEGQEEEEEEEEEEAQRRKTNRFSLTPSDAILEQIAAISKIAVQICVKRTVAGKFNGYAIDNMTGEELWFRILSALVSTVRAIRAISPAPLPSINRPSDRSSSHRRISGASIIFLGDNDSDEPTPLSLRASDILASLIPNALSALVSNTSTREVSFPNLMRRLINSNARSPVADRSYAEFKAIVTSMLDTYAFEGEILAVTSNISAQDLFQHVEEFKLQSEKGWRCQSTLCYECDLPVWGEESLGMGGIGGSKLSRSASVSLVVDSLGLGGRPPMRKRASIKGKEVQWPEGDESVYKPAFEAPKGVVVGKENVWHQNCYLLSKANLGHEMLDRLEIGE